MKKILYLLPLLATSCMSSVPSKLYQKPEAYTATVMIDTHWDDTYPVERFVKKIKQGELYTDSYGMQYSIVEESEGVYLLQIDLPKE